MRIAMLFLFALATAAPAATASAQSTDAPTTSMRPENYLGANVMGLAGFLRLNVGSFEVSYERTIERHHGLQVSGDFIHVHADAAHRATHLWTFGGSLTYRYYFGPGVGPFVGVQLGYRRGFGRDGAAHHGDHDAAHPLDIEQWRAIGQVGYRFFAPGSGLTVVPRLGVGYGEYTVTAHDQSDPAAQASALFARDVLAPWGLVVDFELSIGVGF